MKKLVVCFALALITSMFVGCSTSSMSSWCRSGSIFPTFGSTREKSEKVYLSSGLNACAPSSCQPCEPNACQPCEPVCQPCEPVCNPCEPICNPCDNRFVSGVVTRGITTPHVAN
ncbi:MAG: hypothetical protein FWE67_09535 [Planctomycetaceae bacterium]|nr:hypothetical protein [Planctomycetaceae bacterium]